MRVSPRPTAPEVTRGDKHDWLGETVEAERFVRTVQYDFYEHDRGEVIWTGETACPTVYARWRRKLFATTDTLDNAIAADAIIGDSIQPVHG